MLGGCSVHVGDGNQSPRSLNTGVIQIPRRSPRYRTEIPVGRVRSAPKKASAIRMRRICWQSKENGGATCPNAAPPFSFSIARNMQPGLGVAIPHHDTCPRLSVSAIASGPPLG
ncbi:hypothetical protein RB8511 [Rhodopirellula baltica SH 1]|uniref:Uncharacterized protein n=1 Tax=Rhodopirellula baltica (strain DSM 10527 / NCIMB 13988 / SH1) TaxID=243090 RepID=Q7UFK3_RHOBA|nr:hypothetical protein RB8511 [Rhodopirellula baltica SH 1]